MLGNRRVVLMAALGLLLALATSAPSPARALTPDEMEQLQDDTVRALQQHHLLGASLTLPRNVRMHVSGYMAEDHVDTEVALLHEAVDYNKNSGWPVCDDIRVMPMEWRRIDVRGVVADIDLVTMNYLYRAERPAYNPGLPDKVVWGHHVRMIHEGGEWKLAEMHAYSVDGHHG